MHLVPRRPRAYLSVVRALLFALVASLPGGCVESSEVVPLLAGGLPLTPPTTVPLRVVTRSTAVVDPVHVRGSGISFSDIEAALGHAVASATVPWADARRGIASTGEGWELLVEVIHDAADYDDGRIVFSMAVRATLYQRAGNVYLAQTQANCRQADVAPARRGASALLRCMTGIGRDLAGWLDGVNLDANAIAPTHR